MRFCVTLSLIPLLASVASAQSPGRCSSYGKSCGPTLGGSSVARGPVRRVELLFAGGIKNGSVVAVPNPMSGFLPSGNRFAILTAGLRGTQNVQADRLILATGYRSQIAPLLGIMVQSTGEPLEPSDIRIVAAAVSAWLDTWP